MHRLTIIIMDIAELYRLYLQTGRQATTDSRDCPAGSIFFALKGESFDGNRFAKAALDKGCAYAVVDEAEYADCSGFTQVVLSLFGKHLLRNASEQATQGMEVSGLENAQAGDLAFFCKRSADDLWQRRAR